MTKTIIPNFTGPHGFGARHHHDPAPFSLWDAIKHDFRHPTKNEWAWLVAHFHSGRQIRIREPILFVEARAPPTPRPLTVDGMAVRFIVPTEKEDDPFALMKKDEIPIRCTNNYMDIRSRGQVDPLFPLELKRWKIPGWEEKRALVDMMCGICNPRCIHIVCPIIIVELYHDDGRSYAPGSLPRTVAGCSVVWYHQARSIFEDKVSYLLAENVLLPAFELPPPPAMVPTPNINQPAIEKHRPKHYNPENLDTEVCRHRDAIQQQPPDYPRCSITHPRYLPEPFSTNNYTLTSSAPFSNTIPRSPLALRAENIELGAWFSLTDTFRLSTETPETYLQAVGVSMAIPSAPQPPFPDALSQTPRGQDVEWKDLTLFDVFSPTS
ncbi:MAG: hypothetical protein Q9174_006158 [Haloplaca sp. 1 TL-2023]